MEVLKLNHWITREVPKKAFLNFLLLLLGPGPGLTPRYCVSNGYGHHTLGALATCAPQKFGLFPPLLSPPVHPSFRPPFLCPFLPRPLTPQPFFPLSPKLRLSSLSPLLLAHIPQDLFCISLSFLSSILLLFLSALIHRGRALEGKDLSCHQEESPEANVLDCSLPEEFCSFKQALL